MKNSIRFVTPEEFETIAHIVEGATPATFPAWFGLVLRTLFATGCRPAEVVGTTGRPGRREEEGRGVDESSVRPHHGLRACDVLPNHRLAVEGKNTARGNRGLKRGVVLVADATVWNDLRALADATRHGGNLFIRAGSDGTRVLRHYVGLLRPMLPANVRDFSPRWLRHSHAIAAIRAGVDIVSVQRQLRHESLEITAIYLRFAGLNESAYLRAFGTGHAALEKRDCPSCGFSWEVDRRSGVLSMESRMGTALRRRARA